MRTTRRSASRFGPRPGPAAHWEPTGSSPRWRCRSDAACVHCRPGGRGRHKKTRSDEKMLWLSLFIHIVTHMSKRFRTHSTSSWLTVPAILGLLLVSTQSAMSQPCEGQWDANHPISTVVGTIAALVEMPNGDILVGGVFATAGGIAANNIAVFHPATSTWSTLGSGLTGLNSSVSDIAVLQSGHIVAGGSFTSAGGVPANRIAIWDGNTWSALGAGFPAEVFAIQEMLNGDIVAGGNFSWSTAYPFGFVARWDGSAWYSMANGFGSVVFDLALDHQGNLLAGGNFTQRIAMWTGSSWAQVGAGLNSTVRGIGIVPNGDLIAVGDFTSSAGNPMSKVARWDGESWSAIAPGTITGTMKCVVTFPSGEIFAAGTSAPRRFNGSGGWLSMPGFPLSPNVLTAIGLQNGNILVGSSMGSGRRWTDSQGPNVIGQPTSQQLCNGSSTALSIMAEGIQPIAYQWQFYSHGDIWHNLTANAISLPCGGAIHADQPQENATMVYLYGCESAVPVRCSAINACGSAISASIAISPIQIIPGDVDSDGQITGNDIQAFVAILGASTPGPSNVCSADLDSNGVVGAEDIPEFLEVLMRD